MLSLRLCLFLVLTSGLPAQQAPLGQGMNWYSRDKEVALGEALAGKFRQQTTPVSDAGVQEYLRGLGARLAAGMPASIQSHDYKFTVVAQLPDDCDNATHEPLSLPGGFIFVPASLLLAAGSEAEVAGMLAHAMVHAAARHGTRIATREELIANMRVAHKEVPLVFTFGPCGLGASGPTLASLTLMKFRRDYELESDRVAAGVMARAGYDPVALINYIQRLQSKAPAGSPLTSSMPPRTARVQTIEEVTRELPAGAYPSNNAQFRVVQKALGN